MRRFLRRRFLVAYAAALLLIGSGAFVWMRHGSADVQYRTAAATLGTVTQTLAMSGNLTPVGQTAVDFTGSGRVTAVSATVGQQVAAGSVLATLDASSAQNALSTAQATLAAAQARLSLDEAGPTAQLLASAEAQVSTAQVTLQNDQTSLTDVVAVNQQSVQQAGDALQAAQSQQSSDCGTNPSSSACTQDQQTVRQDQDALQAATVRMQQAVDQAQGQVNAARVQLQNAQAALTALRQGSTPQQIQMDQSQVEIDRINVSSAQATVDNTTLTAPVAGVVSQVNVVVGQQVGGTGGASAASSSSSSSSSDDFVVITPGLFEVTGSVSDAQVNTVAVGQQAQVVPAGSEEAVTGHVTSVAQQATIASGVATFAVTVTIDQPDQALRGGMSASVNVVVNQVVHVLTVPTSAVRTGTSGSTVQVLVNGVAQTRTVQVGAQDALRTQILSGLGAGDQVVIATVSGSVPSGNGGGGLFAGGGRGGFGGGGFGGGGGRAGGGGGG